MTSPDPYTPHAPFVDNVETPQNAYTAGWANNVEGGLDRAWNAIEGLALNVKVVFGAKGDGTTDDTAAIQSAITALGGSGGTVYFPPGTYKITSAISLVSNLVFRGAGDGSTVISQATPTADGLFGNDLTDVTIADMRVQGPGSGSGIGVHFIHTTNPAVVSTTMHSVTVLGFGGNGLDMANAICSAFTRVTSQSNKGHGFYFHGALPTGAAGTSCAFSGCYANGNAGSGYRIENMVYMAFLGCASDNNGIQYEVVGTGTQGITFVGCGCEQATAAGGGYGWKISGATGVQVLGAFIYQNPTIAVWVTGNAKNIFLSGICETAPVAGATNCIKVDAGSHATVCANQNTSPNNYAGGTNILDDGAGAAQFLGYTYFGNTVEVGGDVHVENNLHVGWSQNGGGVQVLPIVNATTVPNTNPSNGGVLYVQGGALKYRGSNGTVTTIGLA